MEEWWYWFIDGFCKVEFACYQGSPNWLGWIIIGFGALLILSITISLLAAIFPDR